MSDTLDLPDGFHEAPSTVQYELLVSYRSEQLAGAIRSELGLTDRDSPYLDKRELADVLLELRDD
jgi:hypothetical protein